MSLTQACCFHPDGFRRDVQRSHDDSQDETEMLMRECQAGDVDSRQLGVRVRSSNSGDLKRTRVPLSSQPEAPESEGAEAWPELDYRMLGKSFASKTSRRNRHAFEKCWGAIEALASSKIEDLYQEKFGELCSFLSQDPSHSEDMVRVAVLYAGFNVADSTVSCKYMSQRLRADCSPYVVVLDPHQCSSFKHSIEALTQQLCVIDEELKNGITEGAPELAKRNGGLGIDPELRPSASRAQGAKHTRKATLRHSTLEQSQASENQFHGKILYKRRRRYSMRESIQLLSERHKDQEGDPKIVVVVEDAENVDPAVLCQLLLTLVHYHGNHKVSVGVAVGLRSCNSQGIHGMLSRRITAQLSIRKFKAKDSLAIIEALFKELLVNGRMPLRLGVKTARWLSDQFLSKEQSIQGFLRALKLACLRHFTRYPCSFVCCIEDMKKEVLTRSEVNSMFELPTVKNIPNLPPAEDFGAREAKATLWINHLVAHGKFWGPIVFQCVYLARRVLLNMGKSHPRATYIDITEESLRLIRDRIQFSESHSIVEAFINQCRESLRGSFDLDDLCASFRREKEQEMVERAKDDLVKQLGDRPSPGGHATNPWKKRGNFRESIQPQKAQTSKARQLVLDWWDHKIIRNWDGRRFPLGELFFFNDVKTLKGSFAAHPRATLCNALLYPGEPFRDHDTCIAYQVLDTSSQKSALPLLDWYSSFTASSAEVMSVARPKKRRQKTSHDAPSEQESLARFLRAASELKAFGLFRTPPRRPDHVLKLVHSLNR